MWKTRLLNAFEMEEVSPYSEYPKFQQLQAEETARIFDSKLTNQILQLNPEINNRLNDGIEVLDIGCGRGHAVNLMGKAFHDPNLLVVIFLRKALPQQKKKPRIWD